MVAASTNRMAIAACDRCGSERGVDWVAGSAIVAPRRLAAGRAAGGGGAGAAARRRRPRRRARQGARAAQRRARRPPPRPVCPGRAAASSVSARDPADLRPVLAHPPRPDRRPARDARPRRDRDRRGRRHDRRHRARRDRPRHALRDITVDAGDEEHERGIVDAVDGVDGAEVLDWTDRTFGMHVGGKIEVRLKHPLRDARRPLDGLHAGRRARLQGDRRGPRQGVPVHDQAQHGRRRQRRHRGARPRRHRPGGRDAGDGGQGDALQGVRRRRRVPDLPRHEGPRRRSSRPSRRSRPASAASTSRTSRAPRCFEIEERLKAELPTSRSSTTTSTAPPSSCWPRCSTPAG